MHKSLSFIALVCVSVAAQAGVVVQQEHGEVGKAKTKATLYLESGKIRVDSGDSQLIFDGDKQVLWMIQPGRGDYMEMTAAQVESMGRMAQQGMGAQQQMAQALANLPPEQRAMAEQAMKARMGAMPGAAPSAPPTITFKQKATGQKVGSFTCTLYEELANGERTAELCAAPLDQVRFSAADQKTMEALAKFMAPLQRMAPKGTWTAPKMEEIHGFPVHSVSYNGSTPTYEMTVLSVEQKAVPAGQFVLPPGLKKMEMPMGGGRPPR